MSDDRRGSEVHPDSDIDYSVEREEIVAAASAGVDDIDDGMSDYQKNYDFTAPEAPAVVIDVGSGFVKAGRAGDDAPVSVFPSVTGTIRRNQVAAIIGASNRKMYVGDEAQSKRGYLHMSNPVKNGIIRDWDGVEAIWNHVFEDQLQVDPSEQCVLLTDPPRQPKNIRKKSAEMMFETFDVPALYFQVQAVLSLYAAGRQSGVVMDIGDGIVHSVPIIDGWCLQHAITRLHLGGYDLTKHMMELLHEDNQNFVSTSNREIVKMMKEEVCYTPLNFRSELKKSQEDETQFEKEYVLPDGNTVTVAAIRFKIPEALFKPTTLGIESPGVHEIVYKAVHKCDIDVRRELLSNIILAGGTTCFPGFPERFQKELEGLFTLTPKTVAPPERKYSAWIGGSILAGLPSFQDMWISRAEYDEVGASVVVRRCFGIDDGFD